MTLVRSGHSAEIECDACGEITRDEGVYEQDDFKFMWNELKRDGWTTGKNGGDWYHWCPKCQPKSRVRDAQRIFGS